MKETQAAPAGAPSRDTGFLKAVAMVTMLVDHVGVIFFPGVQELRIIGRIAFPLFAWCAAVGSRYTRSIFRYALRVLAWGALTQPFYMLALRHRPDELNVMATLLLGILGIAGMKQKKYLSHLWAPPLCVLLGALFTMDYGWKGVLLIQLMYLTLDSRGGLAALMLPFCLYWGTLSGPVTRVLGVPVAIPPATPLTAALSGLLSPFLKLQALALLALPFLLRRRHSALRLPRWLGYAWYPGHLALLYLISRLPG